MIPINLGIFCRIRCCVPDTLMSLAPTYLKMGSKSLRSRIGIFFSKIVKMFQIVGTITWEVETYRKKLEKEIYFSQNIPPYV